MLTAKNMVGDGILRFNTQAKHWLGVWMDAHLTLKEQHNRCIKQPSAVETRL
jgi:hypothetical protein